MARDRKTITDDLAETQAPVDEFWHQQLVSEIEAALDQLEQEIHREAAE